MKLEHLNTTHADYNRDCMERYADLFEGGERMRKNVKRHIVRNDVEPDDVYDRRCATAHYVNYCGSIGGYLGSFLFSRPLILDPSEGFWTDFRENCDGRDGDLHDFLRGRFLEALVKRHAYWRVEFPSPSGQIVSLADYEAQGAGAARLVAVPSEDVIDWETNDRGEYLWVREKSCRKIKQGTGEPCLTIETWTEWRADGTARRWAVEYKGDYLDGKEDVPEVEPPYNPVGAIPLVRFSLPTDLWLMAHIAQPQLEHFRQSVALAWAIRRTCYAMPVFFLEDERTVDKMGAGYYLKLGKDDRLEWPAPPATPFDTIQAYLDRLKDEIYRVAQVMARGVNNNAAALGRSGESKQADDRATEIVLTAYAALVKEATQYTLGLIAQGRNEEAPAVGGMEGYSIVDEKLTVESALTSSTLQIPSVTYRRKLAEKVVFAQLPDLDEADRAKISKEIKAGISAESLQPEPEIEPADEEADEDEAA